jgi:CHAT domain-containing protein/Tfp pilus assembly protein PilF
MYYTQGRYAEAEPLYKRALAISEKALGPDHPDVASSLDNLAEMYVHQGRCAEAEPLHKRALAISEKALGPDHPTVADSVHNLANVYSTRGLYAEAELLYERALAIKEKALGPDHPTVARSLSCLAYVYVHQGRYDQAKPRLDRDIGIIDRAGVAPGDRFGSYRLRAQIAWKTGRRDAAIADLRHALDLAEQQRGGASGAERERALLFTKFSQAFEQMVAWQTEIGDLGEALAAIERSRSRSLVDQMALGSVDLLAGLAPEQAERLRRRESDARARIAELEHRLSLPAQRSGLDDQQRDQLRAQLDKAREDYLDAYRDIRNASPAYRLNLTQDYKPVTLPALQQWAQQHEALVLEYLLGDEGGFVLVVPPGEAKPRLEKLAVRPTEARVLGIDGGPLTATRLKSALRNEKNTGILQRVSTPGSDRSLVDQLAALWQVLVPQAEQKTIREGRVKRLVVLPDGPLALLPFEVLVVEAGQEPKYLLDAGPPILYAPSATVLYNMAERPAAKRATDREPVLAVGDPAYGEVGADDPAPTSSALAALTSRSRYNNGGGRLSRLPYTGWEIQWVAKGYGEAGINVGTLSRTTATERSVRYWSSGRRILHLACHGLADQGHGNFFGALALTPGPKGSADPADDGFLSLAEIYELNLKGTELTILSACQTNYGPQQKGEGTWALSRGFLVAGSRRVVASNWLVDDEAAASLVSVFCGGLAQTEKAGKTIDHAEALQAAKRYIRQQDRWKDPYYWASMVLVGPP